MLMGTQLWGHMQAYDIVKEEAVAQAKIVLEGMLQASPAFVLNRMANFKSKVRPCTSALLLARVVLAEALLSQGHQTQLAPLHESSAWLQILATCTLCFSAHSAHSCHHLPFHEYATSCIPSA